MGAAERDGVFRIKRAKRVRIRFRAVEDPPSCPSSDVTERIAATGFHQDIYFYRSIGIAILFAILTYWLSESAFRSPPVDDEPSWEWFGWAAVVEGEYHPRENGGPIHKFMFGFADEIEVDLSTGFFAWGPYLRDRGALTMWMLFCLIFGIGYSIMRARSWKKNFIKMKYTMSQLSV